MVMIFGFAGQFDKAIAMIEVMPSSNYLAVWIALLGSCRKWGNVKLGKLAFHQAIQLDDNIAAAYIVMANIYSEAGMQEDAEKVKAMTVNIAPWQKPGMSILVDVNGNLQSFSIGKVRMYI